jgi:nucleoside 2-deoxyribosyltransferase
MKVYIATSFHDKERAEFVALMLKEQGHEITCEWWKSKGPSVDEALKDIRGIENCDAIVGLFEKPFIYKGAILELGVAYAMKKIIIVLGKELDSMVFTLLPEFNKAKNLTQVLKYLSYKIKEDVPL